MADRITKARVKKQVRLMLTYGMLLGVGLLMVYPLLFMFFGTFKGNQELLSSLSLWPNTFDLSGYVKGWQGTGQYTFTHFYKNTFLLVLPTVLLTLISSTLVAYGFSRFCYKGRGFLFMLMLSTLMLPETVTIIPKFILFSKLEWFNTYLPFIIPAAFSSNAFFVFMMVQFFRGIPRELDEAAKIDGCNSLRILIEVLVPLLTPVLFSVGIFQFMWTWNDFFNALIYISNVGVFPLSLALKMSIDVSSGVKWNEVLSMSFLAILPSVIIFFLAQKYFVEGIATTGIKG